MERFYKFIKKKRNLRRLSVVWLFLVVFELFCPIFCEEPRLTAQNLPQGKIVTLVTQEEDNSKVPSISNTEGKSSKSFINVCNDECLCHATPCTSFNFVNFKEDTFKSERISIHFGDPIFSSLPPPFQPPKQA